MSQHALALVILGLIIALEGYSLAEKSPRNLWTPKSLLSVPLTVFVYWLLISILV